MTPGEEYEFQAQPENQEPQGRPPGRRRSARLTTLVPVRVPPDMLKEVELALPTGYALPRGRLQNLQLRVVAHRADVLDVPGATALTTLPLTEELRTALASPRQFGECIKQQKMSEGA